MNGNIENSKALIVTRLDSAEVLSSLNLTVHLYILNEIYASNIDSLATDAVAVVYEEEGKI